LQDVIGELELKEGINVLSLFDGMSCGRIALERLGIKIKNYYASEVDKHAIKVSQHNFPDIIKLGDVTKLKYEAGVLYSEFGEFNCGKIDLLIGGSPCQSISNLGKQEGLSGKSGLFYHYLRIKDECAPTNFLLENVVGNKNAIKEISSLLHTEPALINSNMFSAQNRARLYWTDIKIDEFVDKQIKLTDILESGLPEDSKLSIGRLNWILSEKGKQCINKKYASIDPIKAQCLTARSDASWNSNYVTRQGQLSKLTPVEYERLQTVPDNYTNCVSNSQRYKMLGNGWTVDVIAHILKNLNKEFDT
jgi:site-specific DNA-cytosine methylase